MNIRDLVKNVKISLISIFLVCTSSFSYSACGYVEQIKTKLEETENIMEQTSRVLDEEGSKDPLGFACGLNKNLAKKFTSLLDYENRIQDNLEILRNNMGDELFGTLLSGDDIGDRLKNFIGYEMDKQRTLGKIDLRYRIILERCEISLEDFFRDYQVQTLASKRLEKEEKREEKAEKDNVKKKMGEDINQKYLTHFSGITLGEQGKAILSRLDEAQNNIFEALEVLDKYIKAPEGQTEVEKYKTQLEERVEKQQEESKKQEWQSNRYALIVTKLRDRLTHLENIEKELIQLEEIETKTVASYLKYFNFLNDFIYTVADISYITDPDEIKGCIDDFAFPQPLTEDNSVVTLQKKIGKTQMNLSTLRELILQNLIADFQYEESTSTEEQPLINNFGALGIHEKLYTYSLNPYHIRGKHKAWVFWAKLGFTRDDAGILDAKLRLALTKTKGTRTIGKKKDDNKYGKKYTVFPKVIGINLQEGELETAWIYAKISSEQLSGLPESTTIYFN